MIMEDFFSQISQEIITQEDLLSFLDDINTTKKAIFQNPSKPLSQKIQNKTSREFQEVLKRLLTPPLSRDKRKQIELLDELRNYLLSLPKIKLTLAFQPNKEFLKQISKWLQKEVGQKIILDIFVNPHIVSGVIIEYKGKYLDFSLIKEIQQFLKSNERRV